MNPQEFRRRVGTGCFVLLLMPAGAAFAQGRAEARVDACSPARIAHSVAFERARMFGAPPRSAAPWFRRAFVEVRQDGTCAVKAIVPQAAVREAEQPPGVVQNVRRTDRR